MVQEEDILRSDRPYMLYAVRHIQRDAEDIAEFLMDELYLQSKVQPKLLIISDLKAAGSSRVESYSDGASEVPAVRCK